MRTAFAIVGLLTSVTRYAVADSVAGASGQHDRNAAITAFGWRASVRAAAIADDNPWLDLEPAGSPKPLIGAPTAEHKLAAGLTLAVGYLAFSTWTYFAWYRNHQRNEDRPRGCLALIYGGECGPNPNWKFGGDRWFEDDTYAGGADKLGHAWATLALGRAGTELLSQWGGYDRLTASLIGCGLSELLFLGVEFKDAAFYEFSYSDFTFNSIGAILGFAQSNLPWFDDLLDFRVEYWPSRAYRRQFTHDGNINVAEDYSGETFLLAFHLGAITPVREVSRGWARFVDVALGFESRGYKPDQLPGEPDFMHTQRLFVGITLNAQGVFDALLSGRSRAGRKIAHGMFEVFNLPYTTLPILDGTRTAKNIDSDGA